MIRCTYRRRPIPPNTYGPECGAPAEHFFCVMDPADLVFRKGGEGDTHGGYLARCLQHKDCGNDFGAITEDEYVVGVVMES